MTIMTHVTHSCKCQRTLDLGFYDREIDLERFCGAAAACHSCVTCKVRSRTPDFSISMRGLRNRCREFRSARETLFRCGFAGICCEEPDDGGDWLVGGPLGWNLGPTDYES